MTINNKIPDLLVWKNNKAMINAEAAFTFATQYGIPPELLSEMVDELFAKDIFVKAYHIAKAYDVANGTNHHSLITSLVTPS